MMQMIASADGHIVDEWVLTKPAGWNPDPLARAAAMSVFEPHPPSSWLDRIGLSFGIVNSVSHADC